MTIERRVPSADSQMSEELTLAGLSPEHVDTLYDLYEAARASEDQDRAQRGQPAGEGLI